jgi:hypothetical protein
MRRRDRGKAHAQLSLHERRKQAMKKLILFATALLIASGSSVYAREHGRHGYSHARVHGYYGGARGFYGGAYGGPGTAEGRTSG